MEFWPLEVAAINQLLSNFFFEENFQQYLLRHLSTGYKHQSGKKQLHCEYLLSSSLCNKLSLVHWFLYSASWLVILFKSRFFMSILFQQLLRSYSPPSLYLSLLSICGSIYMFRTGSPVRFAVAIKGNSLKRLPTAQWPLVACKVNLSRARVSEAAKA